MRRIGVLPTLIESGPNPCATREELGHYRVHKSWKYEMCNPGHYKENPQGSAGGVEIHSLREIAILTQ
jgi:hypothetical protein